MRKNKWNPEKVLQCRKGLRVAEEKKNSEKDCCKIASFLFFIFYVMAGFARQMIKN